MYCGNVQHNIASSIRADLLLQFLESLGGNKFMLSVVYS